MASVKVTFTLDEATLSCLSQAAERLAKPKSAVVREAIHDYHERIGRLGEAKRIRLLRVLDQVMARAPSRSVSEVNRELRELRRARRKGGRRTASR